MLLQTNSYIVPADKRVEHERLVRRFRQVMHRLGCDLFEVYEQVGPGWASGETTGRFVQIMRFRDRKHQLSVQNAERSDPAAQSLIAEFCELINLPYQQQQGMFGVGYYMSIVAPTRELTAGEEVPAAPAEEPPVEATPEPEPSPEPEPAPDEAEPEAMPLETVEGEEPPAEIDIEALDEEQKQ